MRSGQQFDVGIVGGGFSGMMVAYYSIKAGKSVCLVEKTSNLGGLAESFQFSNGVSVEKYYHHWFLNDIHALELTRELGINDKLIVKDTKNSIFVNGSIWPMSSPIDLLRFRPLDIFSRLRVGLAVVYSRFFRDWRSIERLDIRSWLVPLCGKKGFDIIWRPLIEKKFSKWSDQISAAWMWKKFALRGGSRSRSGGEQLIYLEGGFQGLVDQVEDFLMKGGCVIERNRTVEELGLDNSMKEIWLSGESAPILCSKCIVTTPFPVIRQMLGKDKCPSWLEKTRAIPYLGNVCLVLMLRQSLSDIYWLNVCDIEFPYVGVIEHTNLDDPERYDGKTIVYLSRYTDTQDIVYSMEDKDYYQVACEKLKRIFPKFEEGDVEEYRVWRTPYAQAVTLKGYSGLIPPIHTPIESFYILSMGQIYPEDRGTNYAIKYAKELVESW